MPAHSLMPAGITVDRYLAVQLFLYHEAHLMDENRYSDWLNLFALDARYWIPSNEEDPDPDAHVSILNLDRSGLEAYVGRLEDGKAFAQNPKSRLSRLISNVQVTGFEGDNVQASARFLVTEVRNHAKRVHAGRSDYELMESADGMRISTKKVTLVDINEAQESISFLL